MKEKRDRHDSDTVSLFHFNERIKIKRELIINFFQLKQLEYHH